MDTVLTRLKQPLRNMRQVVQQVAGILESTGAIDKSNIDELVSLEQESLRFYERIKEVRQQAEISYQSRADSQDALPVVENRLRNMETIMGGMPLLLATDEDNLAEFIKWICKAPDMFFKALVSAGSDEFECIRKIVNGANVKRKR